MTGDVISEMIQRCLGLEVTVFYLTAAADSDNGVLTEYDGACVLLERRDQTDLVIPMSAIRMVMTKRDRKSEGRTLPRPVAARSQGE